MQVGYRLALATWPGGDPLFAAVHVTRGSPQAVQELVERLAVPFCLVRPDAAERYGDEHDDLLSLRLGILFAAAEAGDAGALGERATAGGARVGGDASSSGRGVLELEERVRSELERVDEALGVFLHPTGGELASVAVPGAPYVASQEIFVEVRCARDRYYHPARNLSASVVAGTVNLAWTLPPDRWDRLRVMLRRIAGSSPPTTTTGTEVTLSSDLATSASDTPGTGTWTYGVFAGYDESRRWARGQARTGDGGVNAWSEVVATTVTV